MDSFNEVSIVYIYSKIIMFKPREQPEVVNTSAKTTGYDR